MSIRPDRRLRGSDGLAMGLDNAEPIDGNGRNAYSEAPTSARQYDVGFILWFVSLRPGGVS